MNQPIHIISLGAGVQSSVLALMASRGEITPEPKCAIFADTQSEPKSVYDWLDWLEAQLSFPVYRVTVGNLFETALKLRTSKKSGNTYLSPGLPVYTVDSFGKHGLGSRQCTRDAKIAPIQRKIRELVGEEIKQWRKFKKQSIPPVEQWIGISFDEIWRMKPSRLDYITNVHPLVDMKMRRSDCIDWMKQYGYPTPPRSSCYGCPFHNDMEWNRLKRDEPNEFLKAVDFERRLQEAYSHATALDSVPFLHSSRKPLNEIAFSDAENQISNFDNECEGMCGV